LKLDFDQVPSSRYREECLIEGHTSVFGGDADFLQERIVLGKLEIARSLRALRESAQRCIAGNKLNDARLVRLVLQRQKPTMQKKQKQSRPIVGRPCLANTRPDQTYLAQSLGVTSTWISYHPDH